MHVTSGTLWGAPLQTCGEAPHLPFAPRDASGGGGDGGGRPEGRQDNACLLRTRARVCVGRAPPWSGEGTHARSVAATMFVICKPGCATCCTVLSVLGIIFMVRAPRPGPSPHGGARRPRRGRARSWAAKHAVSGQRAPVRDVKRDVRARFSWCCGPSGEMLREGACGAPRGERAWSAPPPTAEPRQLTSMACAFVWMAAAHRFAWAWPSTPPCRSW